MRALVIGSGVVGVTTAYGLHSKGFDVEVLESAPFAGAGASNVNAGLLVPGDSTIWPNPSAPRQVLRAITHPNTGALRIHASALPGLIPWGARFLSACLPAKSQHYTKASLALSRYSYAELEAVLAAEGLDISHMRGGMVFLADSSKRLSECRAAHLALEKLGEKYEVLSPQELVELDSGYAHAARTLAGALYSPSCGSADCGSFTRQMASRLQELGVSFRFNTSARKLIVRSGKICAVETDIGFIESDLVVLAAGYSSPRLTNTLFRLPLIPARGYSVTVPISAPSKAPSIGGVDERRHVAFSRLGDRLRATSTAEIGGQSRVPSAKDYSGILDTIEDLFPNACDWNKAEYSSGNRPMMPSDVPVISGTPVAGLYLNTGHGHLGWTQSCGSARLLVDLITGARPQISPEPYRLAA